MKVPYEFCAHKFLDLWRFEEPLHKALSVKPTAAQIRDALKRFRVSRTFPGLTDEGARQICRDLIRISDRSEGSYVDKVNLLARCFKNHFNRLNLSAASKLLWLRKLKPYLIYDGRAVVGLRRLGSEFEENNYRSYCDAWKKEYEKHSNDMAVAVHGLVKLPRKYTPAFALRDDQLTKLVYADWFVERVFDVYLWERGDKNQI
jgi:hypothetical protein